MFQMFTVTVAEFEVRELDRQAGMPSWTSPSTWASVCAGDGRVGVHPVHAHRADLHVTGRSRRRRSRTWRGP